MFTLKEILEFTKLVGKLKKIERTGWVTWSNIQNPESVAEHIFRTAVLGMIIADSKELDTEKVVRMSLLHDLPEAIIGDWDPIAKKKLGIDTWKRKEKEAVNKMFSLLPANMKEKYIGIWREFEEQKTEEAKVVKQLDRLEMIIQALEYLEEGYKEEDLKEFFDWHVDEFKDPELKKLFDLINKERSKHKAKKQ